jgi:hypothetical protein
MDILSACTLASQFERVTTLCVVQDPLASPMDRRWVLWFPRLMIPAEPSGSKESNRSGYSEGVRLGNSYT